MSWNIDLPLVHGDRRQVLTNSDKITHHAKYSSVMILTMSMAKKCTTLARDGQTTILNALIDEQLPFTTSRQHEHGGPLHIASAT